MLRVISLVDMLPPTTPAGPRSLIARAFRLSGFRRVLRSGSLPRSSVGSAPASLISRPARRSLALRPIHSLNRLTALFFSECFCDDPFVSSLRLLPAGAIQLPGGLFPTENDSLFTAHRTAKSFVVPASAGFPRGTSA